MPREGKTYKGRNYHRMTLAEQFWPKVDKNGTIVPYVGTPCWIWTGSLKTSGYGEICYDRKNMPAHRAALIVTGRDLPGPGEELCHKCDNRRCCNPDHLFIGTRSDNMRDARDKCRLRQQTKPWTIARGERHGSKTHPERIRRGGNHPEAKLTDEQALQSIALKKSGKTYKEIASMFNVSISCIHLICTGKARKHLHGESYADAIRTEAAAE